MIGPLNTTDSSKSVNPTNKTMKNLVNDKTFEQYFEENKDELVFSQPEVSQILNYHLLNSL